MLLNDIVIAEGVTSPHIIENLESNTEYTVKVVNKSGESEEVTFKTKEITYKEVTIVCDLKDKVTESVEENPNDVRWLVSASVPAPSLNASEFTQSMYDAIYSLDGTTVDLQTTTLARNVQINAFLNIVETVDRHDGNYFSNHNATTLIEKANVLREEIKKLEVSSSGYGNGPGGYRYILAWWNSTAWEGGYAHTDDAINTVTREIDPSKYILDDGYLILNTRTYTSDTITPSILSMDYVCAKITILVEED
ncbi:hypothetical protein [Candidatus Enterococcus clewellii]|uniref:Uncharacterized protein n=1 Tax=Candidatus Enterococcus clewellii TaxID=1834193 RepID=A0A242K3Y9_9ENTE|nr:hypothetical protein [Enterococcus sp. 9E7_DIV0242]OTP13719.1 hypothetical protein A5888_003198 [Enterococcus sp. 9E7_DIV0242]